MLHILAMTPCSTTNHIIMRVTWLRQSRRHLWLGGSTFDLTLTCNYTAKWGSLTRQPRSYRHCSGLLPWKQLWAWINTMNEANINLITMESPHNTEKTNMRYGEVFYFEKHVFNSSWFYHRNGCKIFVKRMSNSIVRNLVWNDAYIIIKFVLKVTGCQNYILKHSLIFEDDSIS